MTSYTVSCTFSWPGQLMLASFYAVSCDGCIFSYVLSWIRYPSVYLSSWRTPFECSLVHNRTLFLGDCLLPRIDCIYLEFTRSEIPLSSFPWSRYPGMMVLSLMVHICIRLTAHCRRVYGNVRQLCGLSISLCFIWFLCLSHPS